jgi:hypothetical protein
MVEKDTEVMLATLREYETKLAEALKISTQAQEVVDGLRKTLRALGINPEESSSRRAPKSPEQHEPEPPKSPKAAKGISDPLDLILKERREVTINQAWKELDTRFGIKVSKAAVEQRLKRKKKAGSVKRVKAKRGTNSTWAYRPVEENLHE